MQEDPGGRERRWLASGADVVQDGIEFRATPSKRPATSRKVFTEARTTGHDLGVAQSYPISVGRSARGPLARIFLLFAGKTCTLVTRGHCSTPDNSCERVLMSVCGRVRACMGQHVLVRTVRGQTMGMTGVRAL